MTGDEVLGVGETLDAIRASARDAGFDMRELLVAERGFDWASLTAASQSMSLFSERKIIDLRIPNGKPGRQGSEAICEFLEVASDDLLLLVSAPKLDGSTMSSKWVKAIDQHGVVVRVWPPEAKDFPAWISGRLAKAGLSASRDAVLQLARRVEGNLLAAQQEIDKLSLLITEGEVTAKDIEAAVADSARYDVFLLADEALSGRVQRALRMVGGLRREGTVPVLVLWALAKEARQLAVMREALEQGEPMASLFRTHRVWQKRQAVIRQCLSRIDTAAAVQLIQLCDRADRASKGQSGEDAWQLILRIVLLLSTGRDLQQAS